MENLAGPKQERPSAGETKTGMAVRRPDHLQTPYAQHSFETFSFLFFFFFLFFLNEFNDNSKLSSIKISIPLILLPLSALPHGEYNSSLSSHIIFDMSLFIQKKIDKYNPVLINFCFIGRSRVLYSVTQCLALIEKINTLNY